MADAPLSVRPTPIRDAFKSVGATIAFAGTAINSAVSLGIITAAQGTALEGVVHAVPGVLELIVGVLVVFGVVKRAEAETTSIQDPAVVVNGELVALVPDPAQLDVALGKHAA